MTPDLVQALLNNSHLLIMLPCFLWLFHRMERMEDRFNASIADSNARYDAANQRLDATFTATNQRLDDLYKELISLRKG